MSATKRVLDKRSPKTFLFRKKNKNEKMSKHDANAAP